MPVMIKSQDGGIWEVHGLEPAYSSIGVFIYGYIVDKKLVRLGKYESREQANKVLYKLEQWYADSVSAAAKDESTEGEPSLSAPRVFRMPLVEELAV